MRKPFFMDGNSIVGYPMEPLTSLSSPNTFHNWDHREDVVNPSLSIILS
jgi:hypothetical protein